MNYELAKKLKDAGFPQTRRPSWLYDEDVCEPSLSELIEVLGDKLLWMTHNQNSLGKSLNWTVVGSNNSNVWTRAEEDSLVKVGDTNLEVALAELWLTLNSKVV